MLLPTLEWRLTNNLEWKSFPCRGRFGAKDYCRFQTRPNSSQQSTNTLLLSSPKINFYFFRSQKLQKYKVTRWLVRLQRRAAIGQNLLVPGNANRRTWCKRRYSTMIDEYGHFSRLPDRLGREQTSEKVECLSVSRLSASRRCFCYKIFFFF